MELGRVFRRPICVLPTVDLQLLKIAPLALEVLGRALAAKMMLGLAPSEADCLIEYLLSDIGLDEAHVLATLWEELDNPEQYTVVERGGELFIYKR
jgi:hypothetical protein